MKVRAAVLEAFGKPLVLKDVEAPPLRPGEVLVKVLAAGVCGSDLHITSGKDPRVPLPLIPGHEGVGRATRLGSPRTDITGATVEPGDFIAWDRGATCGRCYYCAVLNEPSMCPERRVLGINMSCAEHPFLNGCYADYVVLSPKTNLLKIDADVAPEVLVSACCSGATAAHAAALAQVKPSDTVVVQGQGPLGLFTLAFALDSGAKQVILIALDEGPRADVARAFGVHEILFIRKTDAEERLERVRELTDGRGADVVFDCAGVPASIREGFDLVGKGGTLLIPGVGAPVGDVPLDLYRLVAARNVRLQGVWVSDTRHFHRAAQLVLSGRFPFERMVSHTFKLEEVQKALGMVAEETLVKGVIIP